MEKLVVVKDSFANAVIPFLALHYDLEVYDLRYFTGSLKEETEIYPEGTRILFLFGIDTLATDPSLAKLAR